LRIPAFTTKCTRNVLAMNTGMTMYAKCPNQYRTWHSLWVGNVAVERLMRTHANTMAAMSMAIMGSWDALSNLVLRYRSSTAASATVAATHIQINGGRNRHNKTKETDTIVITYAVLQWVQQCAPEIYVPIHAVAVRNDVYEPNPDGKYSTASGGWSEMGSNDRRIIVIAREGRTGDRAEGLRTDD